MKRKGLEDHLSHDISDFPFSSPATKIRRLDAELPPAGEEDEPRVPPSVYEDHEPMPEIEESPSPFASANEERAIILFKPLHSPSFVSPSSFSVTVNSEIISGFKSQLPTDAIKRGEEEARCRDKNNDDLAVVPWVPFQFPPAAAAAAELMGGEASMDVEESSDSTLCVEAESLRQWQQQHCLIPQLPQNTSTPITWTTSGD